MIEHVLQVEDRSIRLTSGRCAVQNGVQSDTVRIEIAEGDELASMDSLVLFCADAKGRVTRVMVSDPTTVALPAEALRCVGPVAFSLAGYTEEGQRVVTKAMTPDDCMYVVPSGPYDGSDPAPDQPDLLGQLTSAAQAALDAAAEVETVLGQVDSTTIAAIQQAAEDAVAAKTAAEAAKTAAEQAKADIIAANYMPKTGGAFTGSVSVETGTAEPNVTVKRTVDGAEHQGVMRIDSDGILGIRHTVNGQTVNNMYLEQSKTRLTKPLDPGSGGVPTGGTSGQVLKMGASGPEWTDGLKVGDVIEAMGQISVVDDPEAPTKGIVLDTDQETGETSIHGLGDAPVDEVHVAEVDVETAEDTLAVSAGSLRKYVHSVGNVVRGTASGTVAHADDAYAAKPRELRIKGKTVQNLWVNSSGTWSGVTLTSNEDGSITISGTTTSNSIWAGYAGRFTLKPGSTYTLSVDKALPSNTAFRVEPRDVDGVVIPDALFFVSGSKLTDTFTTPSNTAYVNMLFSSNADVGVALSGTYRVMLNEGDTAEPWCPPGLSSVDELSVVTAGKNLLKPFTDGKVTANDDGSMTVGASTEMWAQGEKNHINLPAGTQVTLSTDTVYDAYNVGFGVFFYASDNSRETIYLYKMLHRTIQLSEDCVAYMCWFNGATTSAATSRVMMEIGSTATGFEPYRGTTTPIDLDGNSLCSLPDGTRDELHIDGGGNVVLEKRTQTIQLDGDGTWSKYYDPFVHYASPWSQYDGSPSGYSPDRNFIDKLPASAVVANGLYSANTNGTSAYLREPTFASDVADVKEWMGANKPIVIMPLLEPQTIALPSVTLPALPAPTVNVWADAEASATGYAMAPDVEMEYERDLDLTIANIEAVLETLLEG